MTSQGPFTFDDNSAGCRAIRDAEGEEIAYTTGLADDDQDRANAALLSASAELLVALKRLTDLTDKATNWHGDMRRAIDEARAAIAKAEARS
jgi:hypothetical protein